MMTQREYLAQLGAPEPTDHQHGHDSIRAVLSTKYKRERDAAESVLGDIVSALCDGGELTDREQFIVDLLKAHYSDAKARPVYSVKQSQP